MRSVVTRTTWPPRPSRSARAFAHRSCSTPSDGWLRAAYPDIQNGVGGVIFTRATPAWKSPAAMGPQKKRSSVAP